MKLDKDRSVLSAKAMNAATKEARLAIKHEREAEAKGQLLSSDLYGLIVEACKKGETKVEMSHNFKTSHHQRRMVPEDEYLFDALKVLNYDIDMQVKDFEHCSKHMIDSTIGSITIDWSFYG